MGKMTSLLFSGWLCFFFILQTSKAEWVPLEPLFETEYGEINDWDESPEDAAEVRDAFLTYEPSLRMAETPPGKYRCSLGTEFLIQSDNFPSNYPPKSKKRWIFKPDSDTFIKVECPKIRIPSSEKCKSDKLITFKGRKFNKGTRRCGRINNYGFDSYEKIKLAFKSNRDSSVSKGFMCHVRCTALPTTTTTTTTTTYSPICPQPQFPSAVPTPVTSCADIPDVDLYGCNCTDCITGIQLTCNFVSRCDFDIFALYDFSNTSVHLEPHYPGVNPLDLTGWFFHNTPYITGLTICLDEDNSHITCPIDMFTNLQTLVYEDCTNIMFNCTAADRTLDSSILDGATTYPVTLPDAADVQNLECLHLYFAELDIDSTTLSGYTNLKALDVISPEVSFDEDSLYANTLLETVFACFSQSSLGQNAFKLDGSNFVSLSIENQDLTPAGLDASFVSFDNYPTDPITIKFNVDDVTFQFISQCPLRTLLETGNVLLEWTSTLDCRSCGGVWYWSTTATALASITATCHDASTSTDYALASYVSGNSNPCGFSIPGC